MTDIAEPGRIRIIDISPTPSAEEMVAIAVVLEEAWPEPVSAAAGTSETDANWRFALRPWRPPAIPVRKWART